MNLQGDMHNREGLTLKRLWIAICDYDLWPLYLLFVICRLRHVTLSLTFLDIYLQRSRVRHSDFAPCNIPHPFASKPWVRSLIID